MKEKEMMTIMSGKQDEQRISSLDIAAVTGKMHKHVLQAIRRPPPLIIPMLRGWASMVRK